YQQAVDIVWRCCCKRGKDLLVGIIHENAFAGTHPQHTVMVLRNNSDAVVAYIAEFVFFIPAGFKSIAVKTVQAPAGPDPHQTFTILNDGGDGIMRQPVIRLVVFEVKRLPFACKGSKKNYSRGKYN